MRWERAGLTRDLIRACGLLDAATVSETVAQDATLDELRLVHTREYIDAVTRAGHGEAGDWHRFCHRATDDPPFPHMHEASARVAGASIAAASAVWAGRADHAFNPAGGLHHATGSLASGFCVYNDPAIAIAWLLANGASRVAYVDVDVHHGDGVQATFWDDPRVLTISLHEDGRWLFPGTGHVDELGGGDARGTKVNVPLLPTTGSAAWLTAFRALVPPLVAAWKPDVLVTQLGCDTHATDPLAHLRLTTSTYREVARELHDLAHSAAGGRWVATGGGGYQWARVVPRAWTIAFAEMCGIELPVDVPSGWLDEVRAMSGADVPTAFLEEATDDNPDVVGATGYVIDEVRSLVFAAHGI